MSRNDNDLYTRITVLSKAWSLLRPHKSFAGMTLEDFKKAVAPSSDTRREVAEMEAATREVKSRRADADTLSRKIVQRVVSGVRADAEEGEDGELYAAMGYVPRSVRISLRSIRRGASAAKDAGKDPAKPAEGSTA